MGNIQTEWRMGLVVPIWKSKRGCARSRKVQGNHTAQPSTEIAERVLDVRIR